MFYLKKKKNKKAWEFIALSFRYVCVMFLRFENWEGPKEGGSKEKRAVETPQLKGFPFPLSPLPPLQLPLLLA